MITIDTETCGLHGPIVLIQYAIDDGPIELYCPWLNPIKETIALFEMMANHPGGVLMFNAAFDWFHIAQMYTTLLLMPDKEDDLRLWIDDYAELEQYGRDGPCIKPVTCCDIMLHARKNEYQSTMDRKDIRIRRVPTQLATPLAKELERRIPFKDIYFARRKDKHAPKWQVVEVEDEYGETDPDWKNIEVKFKPSSALKALAVDAGLVKPEDVIKYGDISAKQYPEELGYAPFATAIGSRRNWNGAWPDKISIHITHWAYNRLARQYAGDDILYTRALWEKFGRPEFGDDDSILACCVAVCRWRGYKVDIEGIKKLKTQVLGRRYKTFNGQSFPIPTAPGDVKRYVLEKLSHIERVALDAAHKNSSSGSTKRVILEKIATFNQPCPTCQHKDQESINPDCATCGGRGLVRDEAAIRATEVLEARKSGKEIELYDKLIHAGRFHASFKVIGTLSSRMSGADKLNAQGIKKSNEVRSKFPLAWSGYALCGGDFEGFEVTIAEACYKDKDLRKDLLTCEKCGNQMLFDKSRFDYFCTECGSDKGKKIHALFGVFVYPGMTYEQIKATDGDKVNDIYTRCKSAIFAMLYGGEGYTLQDRLGVPIEIADEAYAKFIKRYKGVGIERKKIIDMFCSMRQPGGIGTKVEWHDPVETIRTLFGFPRYFTIENKICKTLYELAANVPPSWRSIKMKVMRRDRMQTASGAVASALYGAAFAVQGANTRAGGNHVIQGSGAQITKKVQRRIWDLQPAGVSQWIVQPMNVHDQVLTPVLPEYVDKVTRIVRDAVEEIRPTIPLIRMPWKAWLSDWSDKKGGKKPDTTLPS